MTFASALGTKAPGLDASHLSAGADDVRTQLTLLAILLATSPAIAFGAETATPTSVPGEAVLAQQSETDLSDTVEATADLPAEEPAREPFDLPVDLSASVSTSFSLGSFSRNNFGTRDSVSS